MVATVDFLSPEWLDALAQAVAPLRLGLEREVRLEIRIDGAPRGCVSGYGLVLGAEVLVARGDPAGAGAGLTISMDYPVAVALAQGRLNAQRALARDDLRVAGRPEQAAVAASALVALGDVLAALRARTAFAAVDPAGAG